MISAVCSDIDGTLLDNNRQLSARTIKAIRTIGKSIPIVLASSRMPSAMTHLQEELGIEDYPIICYNGGYVLTKQDGTDHISVVDSVRISYEACARIIALSRSCDVHISLFSEDNWFAEKEDQWTRKEEMVTKVQPTIMPLDEVMVQWKTSGISAHKIMSMGPVDEIEKLSSQLFKHLSDDIHIYRSKSTYLELAPRSVSKASALKLVMGRCYGLGLGEVMAFGDNYNDIEMLQSVGYGIAVGNALEVVKSASRETTLAGVEDGVAVTLEKYFHL